MTTYSHAKLAGTPTWIDLMTQDIDQARTFYQAVFGWEYDIGGAEYCGYTTARLGTRQVAGLAGNQPVLLQCQQPGMCISPPMTSRPMWRSLLN